MGAEEATPISAGREPAALGAPQPGGFRTTRSLGEILIEGDRETVANDPMAKKFYLGDNFTL